jgi:hypothetical protein
VNTNSEESAHTVTMHRLILVALACGSLAIGLQAQAQRKVPIFVGPQTRDGFVDVDGGVLDSIKDIQSELKRSRLFEVVEAADKATMVLVVVGRRLSGSGGAVGITTPGATFGGGTIAGVTQPTFSAPGITTVVPIDRHAIDTVLRVGSYQKPITTEEPNGAGWAQVARLVVRDVTVWLQANAATLNQRLVNAAASTAPNEAKDDPTHQRREAAIASPEPNPVVCSGVAATIVATPGATLAEKIRTVQPDAYRDVTDQKLESLFRLAYPCLPKYQY